MVSKIIYKNLDKVLYPEDKITKRKILEYYQKNAELILRYFKNRPITLQRFPNGIKEEGFFQKNANYFFPKWIKTLPILKQNKEPISLIICNNKSTLFYLVNLGVLSFHLWLSKQDNLNKPDRLIFDLDPSSNSFKDVIKAAKILKRVIEDLNLTPFVMTTGSKGLHVIIPIKKEKDFSFTHEISKKIAMIAFEKNPDLLTLKLTKKERKNKVFIDYIRNSYGQTTIAPYSLRAIRKAPIATPLYWDELNNKNLNAQSYNIDNIEKKLKQDKDPFREISTKAKSLVKVFKEI